MENLKSDTKILKPKSDDSSYFHKTLGNKLELIIISNTKFTKSSIGIGVEVGSYQDFPHQEGIAHFVEHLVFLGSKTYPDENYLKEILSTINGKRNATTRGKTTNYHAAFDNNNLEKIIPPFIYMMIDPLFSQSSVEREVNAVNAEFEGKKKLDSVRKFRLFCQFLTDKSISSFKTGNRQTLNKENLHEDARKFFDEYYSSDVMNCIIATNESTEKVFSLVEPLLLKIENKNLKNKIHIYTSETLFDQKMDKTMFFIEPVSDKHTLKLNWLLFNPPFDDEYQNPLGLAAITFSDQGKKSLSTKLKEENLIFSLSCLKSVITKEQFLLSIEISLTEKGFSNWKSVFKRVVAMVKFFSKNLYKKDLFETSKKLSEILFDFKNRPDPHSTVKSFSIDIFKHSIQNLISCKYLYPNEFRQDLIQEVFDKIASFKNFNVFLSSKSTGETLDKIQEHYETKYTFKDFSEDLIEILENTEPSTEIDFPEPSKFVPNELENRILLRKQKFPVQILKSPHSNIYFKQDYKFNLPKAHFGVKIKINFSDFDLKSLTRLEIISFLFREFSIELKNQISKAFVNCSVNFESNNVTVKVNGFTDSAKKSVLALGEAISKFNPGKYNQFKIDKCIEVLRKTVNSNLKGKSVSIASDNCSAITSIDSFTLKQKQVFLSNYIENPEALSLFWKNYTSRTKFVWLAMGNLSERETVKLALKFEEMFSKEIAEYSYFETNCKLKERQDAFLVKEVEEEDNKNNGIVVRYQVGENSIECAVLARLVSVFLKNKFFNELRTKQQIGYSVSLGMNNCGNIKGIYVKIQSCDFDSFCVLKQIDLFFKEHFEKLESIDKAEFEEIKGSLKESYSREYSSLLDEFNFNWNRVAKSTFDFDIVENKEEFLENIEHEDLISFYREELIKKRRRIISLVNNRNEDKFREEYMKKLKEEGFNVLLLEDDDQLKETTELV